VPKGEKVDEDCEPVNDTPLPYFEFAAMHEVGHLVDEKEGVMTTKGHGAHAGWETHNSDQVALKAAAHFQFDTLAAKDYVKAILRDKNSTPPSANPPPKDPSKSAEWEETRKKVLDWCKSIRASMSPWNDAALSKHVALGDRVYQEAYDDGRWVSYLAEARSKGISGYQFRSPVEWFAELYAAYFSKKLKPNHPYASWIKPLKKIA
jgi:hypothetical protein